MQPAAIDPKLIAPCGMNCAVCMGYLRPKNRCDGCNGEDRTKLKACSVCRIKNCAKLGDGAQYCFACEQFPCARLKHLDKRYRTNYGMSMIDNLHAIEKKGIAAFVKGEARRWQCPQCGARLSVHRDTCLACGARRPGFETGGPATPSSERRSSRQSSKGQD